MAERVAFHDLPAWAFPVTIEISDQETGGLRWSETIPSPGAVRIPGKSETNNGQPVTVRMMFAGGSDVTVHVR